MAHLLSFAVVLVVVDSDVNQYELSCRIMVVRANGGTVCLESWRLLLESRDLNIKSAWLPREPLRIVFGKDQSGEPMQWFEFAIRRCGGLGKTFAF